MTPIYRSDGEWVAIMHQGHLYNVDGEWLGFLIGKDVYDPQGRYLAYISDDRRLLRTRREPRDQPRKTPPPRPERTRFPSSMPLAPMLPALSYSIIDMFEEYPERLMYISDTRPDMGEE
jgi:hypothetical protein